LEVAISTAAPERALLVAPLGLGLHDAELPLPLLEGDPVAEVGVAHGARAPELVEDRLG
jgi:hypothetical protein